MFLLLMLGGGGTYSLVPPQTRMSSITFSEIRMSLGMCNYA
jgi:hypothetical protein